MPASESFTLGRNERLKSKLLIDRLFNGGGSHAMSAFPLRMVYLPVEQDEGQATARIMISVPKRCFKHAVDRNRVKRQVREAYRHNKHLLQTKDGQGMLLAFIWLDATLHDSATVDRKMKNLLTRLSERL